jgi:hypothetical protein
MNSKKWNKIVDSNDSRIYHLYEWGRLLNEVHGHKRIYLGDDFLELPLSVYRIPIVHKNIPVSGGFYLRLIPYWFIKHAMKKINKKGHPAIIYIHPWEFDLEQPRVNSLKQGHYYRLSTTEKKFKRLLKDFEFSSIRDTWRVE